MELTNLRDLFLFFILNLRTYKLLKTPPMSHRTSRGRIHEQFSTFDYIGIAMVAAMLFAGLVLIFKG